MKTVLKIVMLISVMAVLGACTSPRGKVVKELRQMGVNKQPAKCMGRELDDRLRKREMKNLARFLDQVNKRGDARPNRVIRTIRQIDDPAIAEAAVKSGISCTLLR